MNRKEAKLEVERRLAGGQKKAEVFDALSGQGVKDRRLAFLIASRIDPQRAAKIRVHRRILVAIMVLQLVLVLLLALAAATESVVGGLIILVLAGAIGIAFVWGFATNRFGAYHAFVVLTIVQMSRQLRDFGTEPGLTLIVYAVSIALLAYVIYVKQRLFPDFNFIGLRKQNGRYVFVEG